MKIAVLSMDIEDWFHLDYFIDKSVDRSYSMLDGIDNYLEILNDYKIKSTFFVLSDLVSNNKKKIIEISSLGHEIACHGDDHTRPLKIDINSFTERTKNAKRILEDKLGIPICGYRASSFSLDRERLDIIRKIGYLYDSSKNAFEQHPLYGNIDMNGFEKISNNVYMFNNFVEFETSSLCFMRRNIPVSGGGYLRMLPWLLSSRMMNEYMKKNNYYFFYIHPFELSSSFTPPLDSSISMTTKMRFSLGRSSVEKKITKLIGILKKESFQFMTFSELRNILI